MADVLMHAFAMFATKEPSMLSFQDHHRELHIENSFKISAVLRDTQRYSEILRDTQRHSDA